MAIIMSTPINRLVENVYCAFYDRLIPIYCRYFLHSFYLHTLEPNCLLDQTILQITVITKDFGSVKYTTVLRLILKQGNFGIKDLLVFAMLT